MHVWIRSCPHMGQRGGLCAGYESEVEDEAGEAEEQPPARPPPRKPLEPYEVPSSGAFWMHDDRQDGDNEAGCGLGALHPCAAGLCASIPHALLPARCSPAAAAHGKHAARLSSTSVRATEADGAACDRLCARGRRATAQHGEGLPAALVDVGEPACDAGRLEKQRRPRKKLFDPDDGDEKWQHDRFQLLDLPPDMDTYEVRFTPRSSVVAGVLSHAVELGSSRAACTLGPWLAGIIPATDLQLASACDQVACGRRCSEELAGPGCPRKLNWLCELLAGVPGKEGVGQGPARPAVRRRRL